IARQSRNQRLSTTAESCRNAKFRGVSSTEARRKAKEELPALVLPTNNCKRQGRRGIVTLSPAHPLSITRGGQRCEGKAQNRPDRMRWRRHRGAASERRHEGAVRRIGKAALDRFDLRIVKRRQFPAAIRPE